MATLDSVKTKIQSLISKSNSKTGRSDTDMTAAVDALIAGYGQGGGGITPSGSLTITENGTYDVTEKAQAVVDVPIPDTPVGLNARIFQATVTADVTSGNYKIAAANDFIASIRSNPNAFVILRAINPSPSTAMYSMWVAANFTILYTDTTARNVLLFRTTTSATNLTYSQNGLTGANYNGNINVNTDGSLTIRDCNTTYPVKAGTYQIIAGTVEML